LYYNQGSYNTAVGYSADVSNNEQYIYNATALGYDAMAQQSYQVRIGITVLSLPSGGQVGWTIFSRWQV
jgi:hypothetical protein